MNFRVLVTFLFLLIACAYGESTVNTEQIYQEAYESFVKRDYTSASASLDKINPVDQKKPDVLNLRGAIYKRLGELDNAANAYNDALKVNPKDWVPKYNLAEVNFLREEYKSSRSFLEQALASMPEADRLQKQDLILYKVYLTYLLQGDNDKAKLLLDSFDSTSSNPVYYFAQAAWSYKNKDTAKAKTWVDSTVDIYSADLRNSYSQALVDVGWLEPSEGVIAVASTSTPAPSPKIEVASASPSVTPEPMTEIVPLSTNNATPIAVVASSPTNTQNSTLTTITTPDNTVAVEEPAVAETPQKKTSFLKIFLPVLLILGIAAVLLMGLAKRSRIVPAPVDNMGYDAIAASSDPDLSSPGSHRTEGTGPVIEQDPDNTITPALTPIKVTPIQREYAADQEAQAQRDSSKQEPQTSRSTRRIKTSASTGIGASALKATSTPAPANIPKSAPAKPAPKTTKPKTKVVTNKATSPAVGVKKVTSPARKTPATTAAPKMETTGATPVEPEIVAAPTVQPAATTKSPTTKKAAASKSVAPKSSSQAPVAGGESSLARRTRLIPIPTVNVPLTEEARKARVMAANIPTIVVPSGTPQSVIVKSLDAAASAAPQANPKTATKKVVARKSSPVSKPAVSGKIASSPKPKQTVSPVITIPEFEEAGMESPTRTVLRVIPNQTEDDSADKA